MNNLEDIKNRLAAATPGPWWMDDADQVVRADDRGIIYDQSCDSPSQWPDTTAEFIAHAPEDIARLLAQVASVRSACSEIVRRYGTSGTSGYNPAVMDAVLEIEAAITKALDS